jgi:hypothetical protein
MTTQLQILLVEALLYNVAAAEQDPDSGSVRALITYEMQLDLKDLLAHLKGL